MAAESMTRFMPLFSSHDLSFSLKAHLEDHSGASKWRYSRLHDPLLAL